MEVILMLTILKIIFLFIGVLYLSSVILKARYKTNVPSEQIFIMVLGIVGFIVLQFKLY
jgi:hypothetical protein